MEFETLIEAVAYWAKKTPDNICLIDANADREITYGEFWHFIRVFAGRLKFEGVKKGDRVVVRVGTPIETYVAQFAIYLAGGVYCPVEKHMKEIKMLEMLDYYDAKHLISSAEIDFEGMFIDLATVCNDGEELDEYTFPDAEDLCAIVFTTGTTGNAKGVMITHSVCMFFAKEWRDGFGYRQEDIFLLSHPIDRVAGVKAIGSFLISGAASIILSGHIFMSDYFNAIKKYKVTVLKLDYIYEMLLENCPQRLSEIKDQIRVTTFGGIRMNERHKLQLRELLPNTNLFTIYGSTEASPIAFYSFSQNPNKVNCVGKPSSNVRVVLVDDEGNPVPKTENYSGIVALESNAGLFKGYWKAPELTERAIKNGMLITTDIGRMDDEGFLYLLGRRDDVIVTGGHKVAPYEIEYIVMQMPEILECACIPAPNSILGSVPKLFVVMKPGAEFSAKALLNYLAQRIEMFKMPRIVRQADSLPKVGATTKINRKELANYD